MKFEPYTYIAIIPARAGSQGVKRKIFRKVGSTSLLARASRACRNCYKISETYIASDSCEAQSIAERENVGFIELPEAVTSDSARTIDALTFVAATTLMDRPNARVLMTRPTNPFRETNHLLWAIEALELHGMADSLISLTRAPSFSPTRLKQIGENGLVTDPDPNEGPFPYGRQNFDQWFVRNGAIHIVGVSELINRSLWTKRALGFELDQISGFNINTMEDLQIASAIAEAFGR